MAQQNKPPSTSIALSISDIVSTDPVLPGESRELYDACLRSVITELKATTALQIYLAEQMFECLWCGTRFCERWQISSIPLDLGVKSMRADCIIFNCFKRQIHLKTFKKFLSTQITQSIPFARMQ